MRTIHALLLLFTLIAVPSLAQSAPESEKAAEPWAYWAGLDAFITPDDHYVAPTLMADRAWLHLEARYNYEGQDTASAWVGYNINHANRESWVITPMIAAVFGDTSGVAPGVEAIAAWKNFDFYTEGEYLISSGDDEDDFTYFWSELAYSPLEWLRAGIAAQRTRAYETDVDVQRGLLVGLKFGKMTLTTSLFEPGSDDQTVVVTGSTEF